MFGLFESRDHRKRELARHAASRGLHYSDDDPFGCERAPFPLLRRGTYRKVKSVLWRDEDPHVTRVFDYRYFTEVRDTTMPSPLFTGATMLVNASWPSLSITPTAGKLGFQTRLDGHHTFDMLDPAFAETFTVRTSDDEFATALLGAGMRRFLLDTAQALDIEFNGAWVFACAEQIPVELVPNVFGFMDELLDRVPNVVRLLYPPPLDGGLETPMPDPGELVKPEETVSDRMLREYVKRPMSSSRRVMDSMFGFDADMPGFDSSITAAAAEHAVNMSIVDSDAWRDIGDRSGAMAKSELDHDKPRYDLDGNLIRPREQDPWGDGRELPDRDDEG